MAVVGNGEPAKRFAAAGLESELATTMQDIRGCMMYGLFKIIKPAIVSDYPAHPGGLSTAGCQRETKQNMALDCAKGPG
jgi:hypothetical protein